MSDPVAAMQTLVNELNSLKQRIEALENLLDERISVKDASLLFRIPEQTIYRWIREGRVKPVRIGRRIFITRREVLKLLKNREK